MSQVGTTTLTQAKLAQVSRALCALRNPVSVQDDHLRVATGRHFDRVFYNKPTLSPTLFPVSNRSETRPEKKKNPPFNSETVDGLLHAFTSKGAVCEG